MWRYKDINNGMVSHRSRFLDRSDTLILPKRGAFGFRAFCFAWEVFRNARSGRSNAITLPMSAKQTKGRWVVYEQRKGRFILLSRLFTTRAQAEKERDKLEATFIYKKVSFGVGVVKG